MSSVPGSLELVDPICGRTVAEGSCHRHAHGGALFFFCSDECRARFAMAALRIPAPAANATPVPAADAPPAREAVAALLAPSPRRGVEALSLGAVLAAWRERRFAARCCRELLRLYRAIAARRPELGPPELYREVVRSRIGGDATAADSVLEFAEESFAQWPVSRALSFRDVAHYLVVSEFVATHRDARWITADMKRVVHSTIPSGL